MLYEHQRENGGSLSDFFFCLLGISNANNAVKAEQQRIGQTELKVKEKESAVPYSSDTTALLTDTANNINNREVSKRITNR